MSDTALLKRIDAKLTALLNRPKEENWVKVGVIQRLTGWDARDLDTMRKNGLIKMRKTENGFEYLLQSIPEIFLKRPA